MSRPTPVEHSGRPSHVSKITAERATKLIVDVLCTLEYTPMRVLIMNDPCEDDSYATVLINPAYQVMEVSLSTEWETLSDDEQLRILLHESLHIVHCRIDGVMKMISETDELSRSTLTVIEEAYRQACEQTVEQLTNVLRHTYSMKKAWKKIRKMYPKEA